MGKLYVEGFVLVPIAVCGTLMSMMLAAVGQGAMGLGMFLMNSFWMLCTLIALKRKA
jgi:hypothetical protein